MKLTISERRKVPRIPFESEMKFKVLKAKELSENIEFESGMIKNISEYGIGIVVKKLLKEEDIIRLVFNIGPKEFNIFAEVIWCNEIAFSGIYEAGLEFNYIKDEDYDFLRSAIKMLRNMENEKNGEKKI